MKMAGCSLKRVENTVGKGEIACYEQFLLFPQCFQKTYTADMLKHGLVWERVKDKGLKMSLSHPKMDVYQLDKTISKDIKGRKQKQSKHSKRFCLSKQK